MLVLDGSNWGGELTPEIVAKWRVAGVEKYVCGIDLRTENIALARRQLAAARDGGLRLGAYREAYWLTDVQTSLQAVASVLSGFDIEDVGLAFEDTDAPLVGYTTQELVCAWIQHNLDVADRIWGRDRVNIYTAPWWWNPYTGGTTRFSDRKLWVAQYDWQGGLDFQPFGGWTPPCFRKQFRGTTDFCNYSVDVNWEDDEMADTEARKDIAILKQQESLKAAVGENDMKTLITRLRFFGVLPAVEPLKPHLDGG